MKGDFTRITFDPVRHFSRVLMQQGRVQLDADWNEQAAILLHYLQALAADLIGPYGGPENNCGFAITEHGNDFTIGCGHYYVDGILCEISSTEFSVASMSKGGKSVTIPSLTVDNRQFNRDEWVEVIGNKDMHHYKITNIDSKKHELAFDSALPANSAWLRRLISYRQQLDYPGATLSEGVALVYVDVWERHITPIQDDRIREVALGGPDTATRAKVVWQVKVIYQWSDGTKITNSKIFPLDKWNALVSAWNDQAACGLKARLKPGQASADPCIISYKSAYRGQENQLYRVEIHDGGKIDGKSVPTFKWSRDNGSIVAAWLGNNNDGGLIVSNARGFEAGQLIELTGNLDDLHGITGTFRKIVKVENDALYIVPTESWNSDTPRKVRRWDQMETEDIKLTDGAVPIKEGSTDTDWFDLENGIQIQFQFGGRYRTGDYWLIPARTNGTIEWPCELDDRGQLNSDAPIAQSPQGITHHYAPLGIIHFINDKVNLLHDLRHIFSIIK
jgi:hypothetical protein